MNALSSYEHDIHAVDAGYVRPLLAAIHLIVEKGRVAIVDSGSNASVQPLLDALTALDLSPAAVDYLILTHIHLDHAGGAGSLMCLLPNARLLVHPRGVAHMLDPSRLVAGVTAVYGAAAVSRLYGEILPIAGHRIIAATHGLQVDLAGRELLCLDTPGHARHHISILDQRSASFFTGDIFGLSYRELDRDDRQFIFPTTTPVQFDPAAMHASIDLLLSHRPQVMYLTHYSQVRDVAAKAARLHELIDAHVGIARAAQAAGSQRQARIRAGLQELLLSETERFGCQLPTAQVLDIFATDLDLNAQGLAAWLDSPVG
ncbi:MAG: MBL fold metallo-hydrolase [Candidatus Accumulibacter sp.]|uniref:MBL fold metallo-hydrolase n=1 Tax=Accumulibacter sp. TaxID=2053492 RepID=UPI001A59A7D8|nr:MBL fold metallo-hydrolase [Accumulibacter sp.]MBL8392664.1 MBL fold metallo-hydrolase [Accumulibacter sp.]HRD90123.1 MBL fold metallo-hydrolase [Accumulibacter sp.]